jgi:UDP-N-acetyl-D-mannosaminuronic acid dehydrogenase
MKQLQSLNKKIKSKKAKVAVIGLGYVGLPVACMLADAGFKVIGVDLKQDRVDLINQGISPIEGKEPGLSDLLHSVVENGALRATTQYDELKEIDIALIDVETPIDENHIPQYVALRSACNSLGNVLKTGALVVIESTVAPGTVETVVRPTLEESSGKVAGVDFFLGACPERVMPGKLLTNLESMSRVCGGESQDVAEMMKEFYASIVQSDLDTADIITAEITKTAENAYRDVNIAFANELAIICQSIGADFLRVRDLVNKSPGRHVLFAGAGVGGHCIPKDPWLLAYGAQGKLDLKLIPAARSVNDSMPKHIVKLLNKALKHYGEGLKNAKIAILGYAYLAESDDSRNSPSKKLIELLGDENAVCVVQDPYVEKYQQDILDCINGCDAIIFMVAHEVYKDIDLGEVKKRLRFPIIIDGRRIIDPDRANQFGLDYYGIGFGLSKPGSLIR